MTLESTEHKFGDCHMMTSGSIIKVEQHQQTDDGIKMCHWPKSKNVIDLYGKVKTEM